MNTRSPRFAIGLILAASIAAVPHLLADPASPITITDVDTPDPVASGAPITHTITVVNTGGSKITNVVLTDQLQGVAGMGVPPQLQLASSRGSCVQSGDLVTCAAGTIEGNGSWTISIRGLVTAANGTVINNTVSVTGTHSAQNFTTTHTETTLVGSDGGSALPDLTIDKTGPTSVAISSTMIYTLTVNNKGGQNATDIVVVDTVPAQLSGISAVGTSLFTCGVAGQTVTCSGGAVNAGSNATITIQATTPPAVPAPPDNTITNTAVVDPENSIAEGNELNNTSALVNTAIVDTVPTPPLSISVEDSADPVIPGQGVTYTLFVVNNAATRADDVSIVMGTQGLEAASLIVSQTVVDGTVGNSGGCSNTASEANCLVRMLNPGGTITMQVTGYVIGFAGSGIIATGTVTGNIKNKGVSSTDTELTTIKPFIDLTLTKADAPDPVCARSFPGAVPPAVPPFPAPVCLGGLTYTYVVGNSGIGTASNVVVRDPLVPGTIFDVAASSPLCSVDASNVMTCTIPSLPPGTTSFSVTLVAPPGIGTIQNTATVDPYNAIFEADETNNMATATTLVTTGVDLVVWKTDRDAPLGITDGFDPIATSGTQTYTILVDNIGPQDVTGIRVRDTLPSGTIFRDVTMQTNGFTCTYVPATNTLECIGGAIRGTESESYGPAPLGPDRATIKFRLFAQSFEGTMHNEVRVDPLNEIPEINEANNFEFEDTVVNSGGASESAFNELSVDKTQVSPANPVARNALVEYSIIVFNDGTDPAVGVHVRDFLPAGARYVEATGDHEFHCTESGNVVNCTGGTVPANATALPLAAKITIKMFAPDTPGNYTNQVIVDPEHTIPEGNEFNNEDFVPTIVANGGNGPFNDLQIEKTGDANVKPEDVITYTIKVFNAGSDPALNVAVRDVLPTGVVFLTAADAGLGPGAPFTCSEAGGVVDCTGATIGSGGVLTARSIVITVKAPNTTVGPPGLHNVATVDPDNTVPEGDEFNNTDDAFTTVTPVIDLTVEKHGPTSATQGEFTNYTITVTNNGVGGGQAALGVQLHDPLPVGLIPLGYDAGTANNWACQIQGDPINVVDCLGDLSAPADGGNVVTIKIDVFITKEKGVLDNVACVDPANSIAESNELNNCSEFGTFVAPPPPLSPDVIVSKSVDAASTTPGADLQYTITISNAGTAKAKGWDPVSMTGLTLVDPLSNQVTFTNVTTTNGWVCVPVPIPGTVLVVCHDNGSGMNVGDSAQITINAHVKETATVPIVNTATSAQALFDPADCPAGCVNEVTPANTANNTSNVTTAIGSSGFDLAVAAITDVPDPVTPGQGLKYQIVAVNGGTADATNVHIAINIPSAGVTWLSADGSNGFNCGPPVLNVIDCVGTLPGGGSTTITLNFAVLLFGLPPDLNVTATIDPTNAFAELDEGNNQMTETTTISGATCTGCVDLVASQLVLAPELYPGGPLTVTFQIVNVGDLPAVFLPGQKIAALGIVADAAGVVPGAAPVTSNPLITCAISAAGPNFAQAQCEGSLAPGEGVTIIWVPSVPGAADIAIVDGAADPFNAIPEVNEFNNELTRSIGVF